MWRSDGGVAPYGCLCQPKHTDKPKFETSLPIQKMKFPLPNPAKPLDGIPYKWYNKVSVFSSEVLI